MPKDTTSSTIKQPNYKNITVQLQKQNSPITKIKQPNYKNKTDQLQNKTAQLQK